jgi:hypothetical protein
MEKYKQYINNSEYEFVPYSNKYGNGGMTTISNNSFNPNEATELVENGETAITPDGQHLEFEGETHDGPNGGIPTNLPEGTFIFSDRLKMGKKTFASLAKPIQNKITKLEENPSKFAKNSKELLTKQLDFLANNQEQIKQETDMKRSLKYAYGGKIPKYPTGGMIEANIIPKTTPKLKGENDFDYQVQGALLNNKYRNSPVGSLVIGKLGSIESNIGAGVNVTPNRRTNGIGGNAVLGVNSLKENIAPYLAAKVGKKFSSDNVSFTPYLKGRVSTDNNANYGMIGGDFEAGFGDNMGVSLDANYDVVNNRPYVGLGINKRFANGGMVKYDKGGIKFQPQESFDNRLPVENPQYVPSNNYQTDYENNLQNLRKGQFDYENTLYNGLPKNPSFNLQQPNFTPPSQKVGEYTRTAQPVNSKPVNTNSNNRFKNFNNVNWNEMGQIGASVGSNFIQTNRIDNMAKPKTLNNVRLQPGMTNPKYVNLSGQRNAISRVAKSAMDEAGRNFGNSASIQAFKNKARLNELQGLGESYQNQENTNAGIFNQYANQRNEIAAKEALTNAEIDKYNIDTAYGDEMSRVSGKNAATAQLGNTVGQVFGNRTAYKNQLDQANILKNSYNPEVINRAIENGELVYKNGKLEPKAYGGKIKKRSLKNNP